MVVVAVCMAQAGVACAAAVESVGLVLGVGLRLGFRGVVVWG